MVAGAGPAGAARRRGHIPHLAHHAAAGGADRRATGSGGAAAHLPLDPGPLRAGDRGQRGARARTTRHGRATSRGRGSADSGAYRRAGRPQRLPHPGADRRVASAQRTAGEPQADVRPVRDRRLQPPRPRRGADRRRDARSGLQPAVHLRPARRRQDAPAQLDRQPPDHARARADGAGHHRRGLHQRVPGRPRRPQHRDLQDALPRHRRAARRRRPVPRAQDPHRGGVLPHVQRAPRRRPSDRPHLRPAASRPAGARGPPP